MMKRTLYLLPLLVGVAVAVVVAAAYQAEKESHVQRIRYHVQYELEQAQRLLAGSLHTKVHLISTFESAIRANPALSQDDFQTIAHTLLDGVKDVHSLQLAKNNIISHAYPKPDIGQLQEQDPSMTGPVAVKTKAKQAMVTGKPQLAFPDKNSFHGQDFIIFAPVDIVAASGKTVHWGLIILYIDTHEFFAGAGLKLDGDIRIALRNMQGNSDRGRILFGDSAVFDMMPVIMEMSTFGSTWQLAGAPIRGWGASPYAKYFMFGGGFSALAIPVTLWIFISMFISRFEDRQKYRQLVQNAKSIILRIDMSGNIVFSNEYAEHFYGYKPGELIGKPLVGTLAPRKDPDGSSNKRALGRLLKAPESYPFNESVSIRKNGDVVWVSWANEPIYAKDGPVVGVLCVGTDITDRKNMEESIRQREKQYRLLAENVTDVIWGLDADMRFTYVSPSDTSVRGFKSEEVLGQSLSEHLTPASRMRLLDAISFMDTRVGEQVSPPSTTEDLESFCADGSTVWLEARLGLLLNDEGEKIGIQAVCRDISDRKLVEMLRDDMERMAKHDLKTPLGAVIGLPDEIRRMGPLTETQKALLDTIEDAGSTMLKLINRSLDLYKMECGTFVLERTPVDLVKVIEHIKSEAQAHIRGKGISIGVEIVGNDDNENFYVNVDNELSHSMFANLILNALEASPDSGTITVILERNDAITITIRNQGEVPSELRDTFFEKYTTSSHAKGSGLGTYSARLIARTHGGDITVDTSVPNETGVIIVLPE